MTAAITIIGSPISPYVRKVLAILDIKGLPFRCIPQVPLTGDDNFTRISPLRRIPVLVEGDFTLPDSSAIAQYLEDRHPSPSILPADLQARARARWFEEYADDYMGRNVIFHLFFQKVVRPAILKEAPDEALVEGALKEGLPKGLDYLESQLPEDGGYLCGDFSIADIALVPMFWNAGYVGWQIDATRWPKMAAYLKRASQEPSIARFNALADEMMKAGPKEHMALVEKHLHAAA